MATTYYSKGSNVPYNNPAISTTGTLERTVADQIRELTSAAAPVMALVERASVGENGELKRNSGMIKKVKVKAGKKHEWYTYTPLGVTFTADGTGSVTDASGLRLNDIILNTRNMTTGILDAISSNTLTVTTIGSTAFSMQAGDTILLLADAYKEGSSSPEVVMKDYDNNYNLFQRVRYPVYITDEAKLGPHYVGNIYERLKKYNMDHAMRMIEHTFLFGNRAASGESTSTSNLGYVPTMQGMWNWASNSFPCGGSMTYEKFFKDLVTTSGGIPVTVDDNEDLIMLCGRNIYATMLGWQQDKFLLTEPGDFQVFGVKSTKFLTAGPRIEVVKSSAFDQTGMTDKALIFNARDIDYIYQEGEDIHPKNGMQANSELAQMDDIIGWISNRCWSAGANLVKLTGWTA